MIGVGGGAKVELDLLNVMAHPSDVHGFDVRSRSRREKANVIARVNETSSRGGTRASSSVPSAGRFNFEDINRAYDFFAKPGKFGKVIVAVRE